MINQVIRDLEKNLTDNFESPENGNEGIVSLNGNVVILDSIENDVFIVFQCSVGLFLENLKFGGLIDNKNIEEVVVDFETHVIFDVFFDKLENGLSYDRVTSVEKDAGSGEKITIIKVSDDAINLDESKILEYVESADKGLISNFKQHPQTFVDFKPFTVYFSE